LGLKISHEPERKVSAMSSQPGRELLDLVPDGYTLVHRDKFEQAVRMASATGKLPEEFPGILAKGPFVVRMWGLRKLEEQDGAA
jgi:hypothetical protein